MSNNDELPIPPNTTESRESSSMAPLGLIIDQIKGFPESIEFAGKCGEGEVVNIDAEPNEVDGERVKEVNDSNNGEQILEALEKESVEVIDSELNGTGCRNQIEAAEVSPDPDVEAASQNKSEKPTITEVPKVPRVAKRKTDAEGSSSTAEQKKKKLFGEEKNLANLRKNIREIKDENKLDSTTLAAQRRELERLARLQEQQKARREILQKSMRPQIFHRENFEDAFGGTGHSIISGKSSGWEDRSVNIIKGFSEDPHATDSSSQSQDKFSGREEFFSTGIDTAKEIVTIDDSSSDDDCIMLSDDESEDTQKGEFEGEDSHNSGLHVNDTFNVPDEEGRIIVNVGHPENEQDVFVAPQLTTVLKPHQIGGIRFLFDNVIESIDRFSTSSGFGCILAHSMGLGKTLQIVCFCDIFFRSTKAKHVLCITPINTLQNWLSEFDKWLPQNVSEDISPDVIRPRNFKVFTLNDQCKSLTARARLIAQWSREGGVLLIGYELFRLLSLKMLNLGKRKPSEKPESEAHKKLIKEMYSALVKPGPDLVICDEGHRIKNSHASISMALKQINTKRRVVLTGYPLQNNLLEYWCMVDFVRPNYLGSKTEFTNMFERPIQNGQCIDSTPEDKKFMRYRAHVLHSLLVGFVQRRSHVVLQNTLPQKEEYVILVRMTDFQRKLYDAFMNDVVRSKVVSNPLKAFAVCCKIWNHPDVLYDFLIAKKNAADLEIEDITPPTIKNKAINRKADTDCKPDELAFESMQSINTPIERGTSSSKIIDLDTEEVKTDLAVIPGEDTTLVKTKDVSEENNALATPEKETTESGMPYDWAYDLIKDYVPDLIENSPKMEIFFFILEETVRQGDRILVFSQSLLTLNLIERFLKERNIPGEAEEKWAKNTSYFRIDGSTSAMEREKLINDFNRNSKVILFLVSTKAGSLGINLVGANRVIVFDASWNPCHDTQAVCRVYRYGQQKSCFIYRIVMDNCLEKKIYDRQINKQGMADRIVDECNPDAILSLKDITNWSADNEHKLQEVKVEECKDKFMDAVVQKLVEQHNKLLSKEPFLHESLLIDRKEKKLSQLEKRMAQRSYEIAKKAAAKPAYSLPYRFVNQSVDANKQNSLIRNGADKSQLGPRGNRWIPAEVWKRQGMTAHEMILPLDVVIPTSTDKKMNILLKAGQKVMVLKSHKGVYMQLENGKIIAIRTSSKNSIFSPGADHPPKDTHNGNKSLNPLAALANSIDNPEAKNSSDTAEDDSDDVIFINEEIDSTPKEQPKKDEVVAIPSTSTAEKPLSLPLPETQQKQLPQVTNGSSKVEDCAKVEATNHPVIEANTMKTEMEARDDFDYNSMNLNHQAAVIPSTRKSMPNIRNIPAPYPTIYPSLLNAGGSNSDPSMTYQSQSTRSVDDRVHPKEEIRPAIGTNLNDDSLHRSVYPDHRSSSSSSSSLTNLHNMSQSNYLQPSYPPEPTYHGRDHYMEHDSYYKEKLPTNNHHMPHHHSGPPHSLHHTSTTPPPMHYSHQRSYNEPYPSHNPHAHIPNPYDTYKNPAQHPPPPDNNYDPHYSSYSYAMPNYSMPPQQHDLPPYYKYPPSTAPNSNQDFHHNHHQYKMPPASNWAPQSQPLHRNHQWQPE